MSESDTLETELHHARSFCSEEEYPDYLNRHLITYLGNKRALLPQIHQGIQAALQIMGKTRIDFVDLFSGSGVVARLARRYSQNLFCNDLEPYSDVLNRCYQTNADQVPYTELHQELQRLKEATADQCLQAGWISELYAPANDHNIQPDERVFYTRRNAMFLDTFRQALEDSPKPLQPFLLAPVLVQASMHTNTSGVFKGFYKNAEGIGQFGGTGRHALTRILQPIEVRAPLFSRFHCQTHLSQEDATQRLKSLPKVDLAYFDPPYNQHPYGSNYFMLNLLYSYQRPESVSRVSGIPADWRRSVYNQSRHAETALLDAIAMVRSRCVLISYNSEGFIRHEQFINQLQKIGRVQVMERAYNTFRGSRNLAARNLHVTEFLYLVDKRP